MAGMSIESRTAEHEELPAKLKPIPAWVAGEQPVVGPLSHPSVVHAPPVKQDGSNLQPPKTPQGEPVSASTFQSTSNSWTGEAFVDPGPIAHQPSKIDLDTAKSPHEPAQIAADRLDEAKGDLAVARTRLQLAKENFEAMNNQMNNQQYPQYSRQEFNDAKHNVEEKEWAVQTADYRARKADEVYRDALANESTLDYTAMPSAL
jgi:hypothetical protein